jgi:glycosyltransferase involved in cell wall biosynthesis
MEKTPGDVDKVRIKHFSQMNVGGAFIAAKRLVMAQNDIGLTSTLLTRKDFELRHKGINRVERKINHEINQLISPPLTNTYIGGSGKILGGEVTHLHWMPGRVPTIDQLLGPKGPVVWTLHDTNLFTATCHNTFDCIGFHTNCADCPQRGFLPRRYIQKIHSKKRIQIQQTEHLQVVAPSKWIAGLAKESSALEGIPVHVIPNTLSLNTFTPRFRAKNREALNLERKFVVGFVSSKLGEAKGGSRAEKIFKEFLSLNPGKVIGIEIGANLGSNSETLISIATNSEEQISDVLSTCDVLLYTSLAENLPNLLIEAQACGVPVLSAPVGGVAETFKNGSSGFLFKTDNQAMEILEKLYFDIAWKSKVSEESRKFACETFDPVKIASQYLTVYKAGS